MGDLSDPVAPDALEAYWTIPTRGDPSPRGRRGWTVPGTERALDGVSDRRPGRFSDFDYLVQIARGAESVGFHGLLVPYDPLGEESWVTATALAREVPRLRIVPEFQPGFATAVYTAKMSLSFQRYFADRLGWKPALRTDDGVQRAVGDRLDAAGRLARLEEFLVIANGVWNESGYTNVGEHFEVEGGGLFDPSTNAGGFTRQIGRRPVPTVVLDGSTDAELALSARFADLHLFDLDDTLALAGALGRHRQLAEQYGRRVRQGVRLAVLAREDRDEAWRAARRLWARSVDGGDEVLFGQLRTEQATWRGFDHLGLPVAAGLVGSYDDVRERLRALAALGAEVVVLDAVDHLDEVRRIGEFVLSDLAAPLAVAG